MKKGFCFLILILTSLILMNCPQVEAPPDFTPRPQGTPIPAPEDTPDPEPGIGGRVWILPVSQTVSVGDPFTNDLLVDSGSQMLAAYDISVQYNKDIIDVDIYTGNNGVTVGANGFVSAVKNDTSGELEISGFDNMGVGPGTDLELAIINWFGIAEGTTTLTVIIDSLKDGSSNTIGTPQAENGLVTIEAVVGTDTPTPEPTETPTPEPTETPTPEPTETPTPVPTETPTPVPTETPSPEPTEAPTSEPATSPNTDVVGAVWLEPYDLIEADATVFTTEVRVNTGTQKLAAYGIVFEWDLTIIELDKDAEESDNGVVLGADGYLTALNAKEPGILETTGFDLMGKGPGFNLHLFTIHWNAIGTGETYIIITVGVLGDDKLTIIGNPTPNNGRVIVQ